MAIKARVIRRSARAAEVGIADDQRPNVEGRFGYVLRYGDWRLVRVTVGANDPHAPSLMPSDLRDMPWARWQRSASATLRAQSADDSPISEANAALFRLAAVAGAYRANLAAGLKDPVAAIARDYGVKPGTAASWVHRARKAGLLGAAIGRTAGEDVSKGGQS